MSNRFPESLLTNSGERAALALLYENLLMSARQHHTLTGRHLQIYGELAELYGAAVWGIRRHRVHAAGSDGLLGRQHVEIKSIGPSNRTATTKVKMTGNFSDLLVVRFFDDFTVEGRMIARADLSGTSQVQRNVRWDDLPASTAPLEGENPLA